jgi:hypothetical protein
MVHLPWPDEILSLQQKARRPAGFFHRLAVRRGRRTAGNHMWSIMTWPKPEHDTWVAPSIRRAKS